MQGTRGREDENWRGKEESKKDGLVWAAAEEVNCNVFRFRFTLYTLHFTVTFSIYSRSFCSLSAFVFNFLSAAGSVHRFWWSNRNRTEPERIFGFSNRFNRFFISVRFSRLIFHRFSRFFRLFGFFEHP